MTDTQMFVEHRPSRGVRLAWLIPGAVLAVAALAWGTLNVLGLLAHGEYTTTTTFAGGDVTAIDIANDNGSVNVIGGTVDEIVVTADVDDGWRTTDVTQRIVGGVLEVRGRCPWLGSPWCNVDFTVTVPADVPLAVDGSDGSVSVRGMESAIDVDTDNGSVLLEEVGGRVRASSDNGRLVGRRLTASGVDASTDNGRIELSFLDPPDSVSARTSNGSIEVVVPDDSVLYRVDMRTNNGSTDSTVRTDPGSDHVVDVRTDNGSITVRPPG
jgi:Toastrack DUF4097